MVGIAAAHVAGAPEFGEWKAALAGNPHPTSPLDAGRVASFLASREA